MPGQLNKDILAYVGQVAAEEGVDPGFAMAVARQESGGNPYARSPKGAMGVMQLMPGTASRLGVTNPWDVDQNVRGGLRYLKQQLATFRGNKALAAAAYNAGPGRVLAAGGVPRIAETQQFVRNVMGGAMANTGAQMGGGFAPEEGLQRRNRKTGEVQVFRGGQWQPVAPAQAPAAPATAPAPTPTPAAPTPAPTPESDFLPTMVGQLQPRPSAREFASANLPISSVTRHKVTSPVEGEIMHPMSTLGRKPGPEADFLGAMGHPPEMSLPMQQALTAISGLDNHITNAVQAAFRPFPKAESAVANLYGSSLAGIAKIGAYLAPQGSSVKQYLENAPTEMDAWNYKLKQRLNEQEGRGPATEREMPMYAKELPSFAGSMAPGMGAVGVLDKGAKAANIAGRFPGLANAVARHPCKLWGA